MHPSEKPVYLHWRVPFTGHSWIQCFMMCGINDERWKESQSELGEVKWDKKNTYSTIYKSYTYVAPANYTHTWNKCFIAVNRHFGYSLFLYPLTNTYTPSFILHKFPWRITHLSTDLYTYCQQCNQIINNSLLHTHIYSYILFVYIIIKWIRMVILVWYMTGILTIMLPGSNKKNSSYLYNNDQH